MSIATHVNHNFASKKNDYPYIYYFDNEQIEWNPKKDIADIIKEIYNEKDIKVSKYNDIVEVKSRKKLSISNDIRLQEHLRSSTEQPYISVTKSIMPHIPFG